jgi:hypothetical protein
MVDFQPVVSNLPSIGQCGVCGRHVPLMYDCQTIATHPFFGFQVRVHTLTNTLDRMIDGQ